MELYNEPIAAAMVGLLLSVSAGFRIMLPLLAVNLLAFYQVVKLPDDMTWLGTEPTLIILAVAAVTETVVHFIPAAGTWLKACATPLAFVSGTLLMAVPLSGHNPLYQWTIAAGVGGGVATLTHLGVTGFRAMTAPANVASAGMFGLVWNVAEFFISILFTLLSGLCIIAGYAIALAALVGLIALGTVLLARSLGQWTRSRPAIS